MQINFALKCSQRILRFGPIRSQRGFQAFKSKEEMKILDPPIGEFIVLFRVIHTLTHTLAFKNLVL